MTRRIASLRGLSLAAIALGGTAWAQQAKTYTTDADFDLGTLINVNHTDVHDQLQINTVANTAPLPVVNIAASGDDKLVRIDANTGQILGEYATHPAGLAGNPSRTSVDYFGNVWVGNRDEASGIPSDPFGTHGSVVKIGICLGGTRCDANGVPNPTGEFLKPPFLYNTCVDRNGDGLIHTSRGAGDVRRWPNITDGDGGTDGIVQDAEDEAILVFQRVHGQQVRHVSVDADNNVWVGGYPFFPDFFDKLDGNTGAILSTFASPGCGGHGGVVDGHNVLWSTAEADNAVLRRDLATQASICIPVRGDHGLGIDPAGNIWVCQFSQGRITKIAPDGTIFPGFPVTTGGSLGDRSVAVTPVDSNVWVDGSAGHDVSRLDNNGNIRKVIDLGLDGQSPRGLAVDGNGKVWVACTQSSTVKRIDPNGAADHLGAVDLTVPLDPSALPYDYSDMTGITPLVNTQPSGSWDVVYDSTVANTEYGRISWHELVPPTTSLTVEFRASNTLAQLPSLPFMTAQNGVLFSGIFGRFVEIRVTLRRPFQSTVTPVLFDLTIEPLGGGGGSNCISGIRNPASLLVFPEFDNRNGDVSLITVTNTDDTFNNDVDVEFVYIGRVDNQNHLIDCVEFNTTHRLTPLDTFTTLTRADDPNQNQGFVYVFAKNRYTGAAIVHDALIGNELIINGINLLTYSFNPYAFLGVGIEGTPTDHDGDGVRDLNGLEYTCAPDEILIPRFFGQGPAPFYDSHLVLINLTGGSGFTATLDLLVYNDNEQVFSAQTSFQCWAKPSLLEISHVFDANFLLATNHSANEPLGLPGIPTGWFRINGNSATSSVTTLPDPAILALLVERRSFTADKYGPAQTGFSACDLPWETGAQSNGDLLLVGNTGDSTP